VRRACHVDGMSAREASRQFGIDRKTVSKILKHSLPPGYRRKGPPVRPKLDPFIGIIDQILLDVDKRDNVIALGPSGSALVWPLAKRA